MKKKFLKYFIKEMCLVLAIVLFGIIQFYTYKEKSNNRIDENGIDDEVNEIITDTAIQGVVESSDMEEIYIFNGQHFGELELEMEEYARANIINNKQKCIDYYTSKEYDTSYIQEGDIIICTGDFTKYKYDSWMYDFNTKDYPIIVLKLEDYNKMKEEALKNRKMILATVADYSSASGKIYIKYDIFDKDYNFPFILYFSYRENIGLKRGDKIKVEHEDSNVPLDELELKSIEVIK